jgi:hypothetical protein
MRARANLGLLLIENFARISAGHTSPSILLQRASQRPEVTLGSLEVGNLHPAENTILSFAELKELRAAIGQSIDTHLLRLADILATQRHGPS